MRFCFQTMAALSRLFGKSKREVASPTDHLETVEKEDAVIVTNTAPQQKMENLPYQLPNRQSQHHSVHNPVESLDQMNLGKQDGGWQPLAGVKFSLHSRWSQVA